MRIAEKEEEAVNYEMYFVLLDILNDEFFTKTIY